MVQRLKVEGWEGVKGGRDLPSVTYRQFLALLWGIKGPKSTRRSIGRRVWDAMVARYACVHGNAFFASVPSSFASNNCGFWILVAVVILLRGFVGALSCSILNIVLAVGVLFVWVLVEHLLVFEFPSWLFGIQHY